MAYKAAVCNNCGAVWERDDSLEEEAKSYSISNCSSCPEEREKYFSSQIEFTAKGMKTFSKGALND